jgi:hypothetical protein
MMLSLDIRIVSLIRRLPGALQGVQMADASLAHGIVRFTFEALRMDGGFYGLRCGVLARRRVTRVGRLRLLSANNRQQP